MLGKKLSSFVVLGALAVALAPRCGGSTSTDDGGLDGNVANDGTTRRRHWFESDWQRRIADQRRNTDDRRQSNDRRWRTAVHGRSELRATDAVLRPARRSMRAVFERHELRTESTLLREPHVRAVHDGSKLRWSDAVLRSRRRVRAMPHANELPEQPDMRREERLSLRSVVYDRSELSGPHAEVRHARRLLRAMSRVDGLRKQRDGQGVQHDERPLRRVFAKHGLHDRAASEVQHERQLLRAVFAKHRLPKQSDVQPAGCLHLIACAALFAFACEPVAPTQPSPVVSASVAADPPAADDCRRDIPDCSAACALRATNHLEFIDWYDRRCAAVVLGKNPDKVAGVAPDADASAAASPRSDDLLANPYR